MRTPENFESIARHRGEVVSLGPWTTGFLTVDGAKMSKSRGTFITAQSYLEQGLNPE